MRTTAPSSDAFKFVDVLAPRRSQSERRRYVVTRGQLEFPATEFETKLTNIEVEEDYIAALKRALVELGDRPSASDLNYGYLADLDTYASLLFRNANAEELLRSELSELRARLQQQRSDDDYLLRPAAKSWELYVAGFIAELLGEPWDADLRARNADGVRVAAALFRAVRIRNGEDEELANLSIATFAIGTDLVSRERLRPARPEGEISDDRARARQTKLIDRLLRLERADDELRLAFASHVVIFEQGVALAAIDASGESEEELNVAAPAPVAQVPKSILSKSTIDVLLSNFEAKETDTHIGFALLPTLGKLDALLKSDGSALFDSASAQSVSATCDALALLKFELADSDRSADVGDRVATLPLITPMSASSQRRLRATANEAVRPLGVAHLKTVKQSLLRYQAGEVAHIENVLAGQERERTHSVKQTTEETLIAETERSTSSERDLQSTDRFELGEETAATISKRQQTEAGVTVTASYGPVSISANTKYSDESSNEVASKVSRKFVREVVDRSVEKVQQRVREERIRKTTLTIEELNRHILKADGKNVVGVYRWVDKIYWAQVHVYDKRLLLEFTVPEPSAVYLHGKRAKPADPTAVAPPEPFAIKPSDIRRYTYQSLASRWGAEVDNPPPSARLVKYGSRAHSDTERAKISLEEGWIALTAGPSLSWTAQSGGSVTIHIGTELWSTKQTPWFYQSLESQASGDIPILVTGFRATTYNVTAAVVATPSEELFEKWQLDTYKALLSAFNLRKMEYDEYVARRAGRDNQPTVAPDQVNREVERLELQRSCLEILTRQHFEGRGAIDIGTPSGWPEIDFDEADKQGKEVLFFQHGLEWGEMTYVFYPYFWSDQSRWPAKLNVTGGDALFGRFLSAGFARVIVPVRPAHEADMLYFLENGVINGGKEPPTIGDPDYLDIIDEIKETLDAPDQSTPEGDPWQFKIPSSLIILDEDGKLPEWLEALPTTPTFQASRALCGGVPYNAAQWKDSKTIADGIRKLGYAIEVTGDQGEALRNARPTLRAMQVRFNELGVTSYIGGTLKTDGRVGPCTLRALTYFDALRVSGKWPGV